MQKPFSFWITVLFFCPSVLFSLPPTENAHGIIVKFRNAKRESFKTRDQLHAQNGTKLVYRPKRSPYDFVTPKDEDKQHDFAALSKICDTYLTASSPVAECEVNYDLYARSNPPAECTLTNLNGNPLLKDASLSPFWAQEMVGVDLVAFPRNAAKMGIAAVKVAVIDQSFGDQPANLSKKLVRSLTPSNTAGENHGALSLTLLNGALPYSLQAPIELTQLFEVRTSADYLRALDLIEEAKQPPAVIQISVGLAGSSPAVREVLKRLSQKSILVAAAGNQWPEVMESNEKDFPGILVGSLSPEGYSTSNTQAGDAVTIHAPSDRYLQSSVDGKKASSFGGTSGATAVVASAVAAARSLVPDLSMAHTKQILTTTALSAPGGPSLNAVKFLAVADRIRSQNLSGSVRDRAIKTGPRGKLYQFEKESAEVLTKAVSVLADAETPCATRSIAYQQLRRAFFLNPESDARVQLSQSLSNQGLTTNSLFVENVDRAALLTHLATHVTATDTALRVGAARAAGRLGTGAVDLLIQFAQTGERTPASQGTQAESVSATLQAIADGMPQEAHNQLLSRMRSHDNADVSKLGQSLK
jgi:hypothetical protein